MSAALIVALWISSTSVSMAQRVELQPADRRSEPVVRAGLSDEVAPSTSDVREGFVVRTWANETLLANPVAMSFDFSGRLFVAETHRYRTSALDVRDYPPLVERDFASRTPDDLTRLLQDSFGDQVDQLDVESERLRVLHDANADGTADASELFAEGFNRTIDGMVGGLLVERGNVWLLNSPSLWKLAVPSSGNPADRRDEVVRGLGVHLGRPTHGARGIAVGPDGKIYFAVGDRGSRVERDDGAIHNHPDTGVVYRSNRDGSGLEIFATGLRNPSDLVFDEFGNLFTLDGASGVGDRARVVYLLDGGESGWRNGYAERASESANLWINAGLWQTPFEEQPAYILPPIGNLDYTPLGFTSDTGAYSGASGGSARSFAFCHFAGNAAESGVRTFELQNAGAGFRISRPKDLVRGILATDVAVGPDSRLYVADWVSRSPWPKPGRGRILVVDAARLSEADRKYTEDTRELLRRGVTGLSAHELTALLAHRDQRVRLAAQFELAGQGAASLPAFVALAKNPQAPRLARIHALWGAGQLADGVPAALNHVPALLRDHDPEVRAQSARMLGEYFRFESMRFLVAALEDPDQRVVLFAAQSLGKLKQKEAIPRLIEVLRRNDNRDLVLRHGVVVALARLGADPALTRTLQDPSRAVRLGGLLVHRRLGDAAIAGFLQDFDPLIVREAALAIYDQPIEAALPALAGLLEHAPLDDVALIQRAIHAHFVLGQPENASALANFAGRSYVPASLRREAIDCLAVWPYPPQRDRLTGLYRSRPARDGEPARQALREFLSGLSGQAPEEVQIATINAVAALKIPSTGHALWDVVFQDTHPVKARIAALQALERVNDLRLEVAAQHAARSRSSELRQAALPVLFRLHPGVALPILKEAVTKGTAEDMKSAFPLLSRIEDSRVDEILLAALERFRTGQVPVAAHTELLNAAESRQSPAVSAALGQIEKEQRAAEDRLAAYRPALEGGDPVQGRPLFERHPQLSCIQCHDDVRATGEAPGWLRSLASFGEPRAILEAILYPNARANPGHERTLFTLRGGGAAAGVVQEESDSVVRLGVSAQTARTIPKDSVIRRATLRCRMPAGVAEALSRSELRDITAYLSRLADRSSDRLDREDQYEGTGSLVDPRKNARSTKPASPRVTPDFLAD